MAIKSFTHLCWKRFISSRRLFSQSSLSTPNQNVIYLRDEKKGLEVFLIGTAHISKKSAMEVRDLIQFVKPNVVVVELCQERANKLNGGPLTQTEEVKQLVNYFQHNKLFGFLQQFDRMKNFFKSQTHSHNQDESNSFDLTKYLTRIYDYLKHLGFIPGLEFKVAMEEAQKLGAQIVLGDRSQKETSKRLSEEMPDPLQLLQKISTLDTFPSFTMSSGSLEDSIEAIKNRKKIREMVQFIEKMGGKKFLTALLDERDIYLTKSIKNCSPGSRIVAVVGLAHLDGIEKYWSSIKS